MKVLALEEEPEEQNAQELAEISVDETLHFEENENEIVNTQINNAKIISEDVSISTEKGRSLYLVQIRNNILTNQIGN